MIKKSDNINVTIDLKSNIFTTTAKESSTGLWFDNVYFANRVNYDIVNNKIIVKVGAQVSASLYVGEIVMEYAFKNKRMEVTNIIFKEFKNSNIFK